MKTFLLLACLLLAAPAAAQGPIIIDANSKLAWDVTTPDATTAQSLIYKVSVDGGTPVTLSPVTCVAGTAPAFTCSTPVSQIPLGAHSVTITAGTLTVTSAPSVTYAYIDLLVPVPQNVRVK